MLTSAIGRRLRGAAHSMFALAVGGLLLASVAGAQVGDYSWVTYPGWVPSDRVVPRVTAIAWIPVGWDRHLHKVTGSAQLYP